MKARPVLMHARSIGNLLAGRKTQTRRIVRWKGVHDGLNLGFSRLTVHHSDYGRGFVLVSREGDGQWAHRCAFTPCPYGAPGDLLWVRETFRPVHSGDPSRGARYRADPGEHWHPWKPGIHMPRWASRITLRLTEVRVERVQSISVADILSEGVILPADDAGHVAAWASLWDDTNGTGAWDRNDWTWALSFEVLRENVDTVLARAKVAA